MTGVNYTFIMLKYPLRYILVFFIFCSLVAGLMPQKIAAADFSISPVRIFFDSRENTAILTVTNDSEEDMALQLKMFAWNQDGTGRDIYTPTEDIIYFPRIFKLAAGENKIVRIGTQISPGDREITYRMYMEEMPNPRVTNDTEVRILMKVGIPIFIKPLKEEIKASIISSSLQHDGLAVTVKNGGNRHLVVLEAGATGIDEAGNLVYSSKAGGGYIQGGNTKNIIIEFPAEDCLHTKSIKINIKTDTISLDDTLEITKEMCVF